MKKLFCALITLTIMAIALPTQCATYKTTNHDHLLCATDIGNHAQINVEKATIDLPSALHTLTIAPHDLPMATTNGASFTSSTAAKYPAEALPQRLRLLLSAKLSKQSKYIGATATLLRDNPQRSTYKRTTFDS